MRRIPDSIDLSILSFLEYGDITLIANEEKKEGRKTDPSYVGKVCKGRHRNDRILKKAFELALKKRNQFPIQVLKSRWAEVIGNIYQNTDLL